MPLGREFWEGVGEQRSASQENCLFDNHRFTHERWGGDFGKFAVFGANAITEISNSTLPYLRGKSLCFRKLNNAKQVPFGA